MSTTILPTPDAAHRREPNETRRLPIGAECLPGGVNFRVWAPEARRVRACLEDSAEEVELKAEPGGYFSGVSAAAGPGTRYRFRLDAGEEKYPDPASRFQPAGPFGPSEVVDPAGFAWTDQGWTGPAMSGQVVYEMHVGTLTREGDWSTAARQLPWLAELGVTLLEVMPIAEFPGRFGWGYDGVNLFAPTRLYGQPDDVRRFVDAAHGLGLSVILDVVYNHLGPDGNFLKSFAKDYFSEKHTTDWGEAINFDGESCGPVREFFLANAAYWIDEFHFDGLRLDATQDIHDDSREHILAAISRRTRDAAGGRSVVLIAENEPQDARLVRSRDAGGHGLDAIWNDDFHHSAMVLLSGRNEAYYSDYRGRPQEFISAAKRGFLYQGQWYHWQKKPRGTATGGIPATAFVQFIQNHDQVANTALGQRAHTITSPGRYRAMTALLLLAPQTPMLFQGQEFAASSPFYYFADHKPELAELVDRGRKEFLKQFPSIARPDVQRQLPRPSDPATFERSKLDAGERESHEPAVRLHRDLLRLRREDAVFRSRRIGAVDGAVLAEEAFVLRFFSEDKEGDDRLLLINFDPDLHLRPMPEPLLAPPSGAAWKVLWSSEDLCYGGAGAPPLEEDGTWLVPGQAALVLRPR